MREWKLDLICQDRREEGWSSEAWASPIFAVLTLIYNPRELPD